jgi:uncharacterized protein DUF4388
MSVRGSLRTMAVEDLLDWIDRRHLVGSLTVERGPLVRTLEVDAGRAVGARSNDPNEQLGQLLLRTGTVDEKSLGEAFSVRSDTGVSIGKILLMVGGVQEPILRGVLVTKIREAVWDALTWTEGTFLFEPGATPPGSAYEVSVDLGDCLTLTRQRASRWEQIRAIVPGDDAMIWIKDARLAVTAADPLAVRSSAERILDLARRGLTVGQMILEERGERFATLDRLTALVERSALGVERRRAMRPGTGASAAEMAEAARGRASGGDKSGALELVGRALAMAPGDGSLRALYRELERAVFAELSRDLLTRFRVPRLLKSRDELESLDLTDTERYLAGRVDGRWDLLSLMRVAPLREVEALLTFKRLADRGIIAL